MPRERDLAGRDTRDVEDGNPSVGAVDREERDERVADPRCDDGLHDRAVVRPEHHVGVGAAGAEQGLASLARAPVADERQTGDLPRTQRSALLRHARGLRREEDVRVAQHLDVVERRVVGPADEREVELAAGDELQELVLVVRLGHAKLDPGMGVAHATHDLGEQPDADRLEHPHAQRPRVTGAKRGKVGLRCPQRRSRPSRVPKQPFTGVGRNDRLPTTRPVEESHARDALERRDLLADRRLRVAEASARGGERAGVDHGLERGEMSYLDTLQSIEICDR